MSSRATSVRPPYISIRARALSSATSPVSVSKPIVSVDVAAPPKSSSVAIAEMSEHASMSPTFIASFSSLITSRGNKHMYSLPSSASSSSDSLSLPLPASPKQAVFGAEIWEQDGQYRVGGRPNNKEALHWWSWSVSVRIYSRSHPFVFLILISVDDTHGFYFNTVSINHFSRHYGNFHITNHCYFSSYGF